MGDGSLSQDEIDALLNMGDDADAGPADMASSGGGGDAASDLDLDSLIGGGGGGAGGLDAAALDALAGAVGGSSGSSAPVARAGGGGGGGRQGGDSHDNVDLLLDVTLRFSVELGRTHMFIKDVLQLAEGSVVELDKGIGDEVDILVNDRIFGRGKLIVLDDFFAVQITHILDPMERFRLLS